MLPFCWSNGQYLDRGFCSLWASLCTWQNRYVTGTISMKIFINADKVLLYLLLKPDWFNNLVRKNFFKRVFRIYFSIFFGNPYHLLTLTPSNEKIRDNAGKICLVM